MVTPKDGQWEKQAQQIEDLDTRVRNLSETNSKLLDEVAVLKNNYNRLVEDVGVRLEAVHKKIFR
jgi:predicted nuclease with TOPRIM domain